MAEDFPGKIFENHPDNKKEGSRGGKHKDWKKSKHESGGDSFVELLIFPALIFGEILSQLFG